MEVVAVEVLSLFLRERNIKEPAASKYNRRGFLTQIYKPLLLQTAWALQSLVPPRWCPRAVSGLIQGMGVLLPNPLLLLGSREVPRCLLGTLPHGPHEPGEAHVLGLLQAPHQPLLHDGNKLLVAQLPVPCEKEEK